MGGFTGSLYFRPCFAFGIGWTFFGSQQYWPLVLSAQLRLADMALSPQFDQSSTYQGPYLLCYLTVCHCYHGYGLLTWWIIDLVTEIPPTTQITHVDSKTWINKANCYPTGLMFSLIIEFSWRVLILSEKTRRLGRVCVSRQENSMFGSSRELPGKFSRQVRWVRSSLTFAVHWQNKDRLALVSLIL